MNGIKLISTGSALPKQAVTNHDMAKIVDTNDEWIVSRTGISSRHHCSDGENHTGLCLAAARYKKFRLMGSKALGKERP